MCKVTKFSEKTGEFKTQNFRDLDFRNKETEPGEKNHDKLNDKSKLVTDCKNNGQGYSKQKKVKYYLISNLTDKGKPS